MINKENVTLLRQFLRLYCPSKPINDVCIILIIWDLSRRCFSLYQYYLGYYMVNHNVFLISFLNRESISFTSVHDQ